MPSFVNIGRAEYNLSGNTSKGYVIERKGKTVIVKFGAIHSRSRKYFWAGYSLPFVKKKNFKSIAKAEEYKKRKIREREGKGYSQLMSFSKILQKKRMIEKKL